MTTPTERMTSRSGTDLSLSIRAAWLHYVGRLTQAEVAKRLGVSKVKAHRLIASADLAGAVKVSIEGDIAACLALEDRISERFGLEFCHVVPDLHEGELPLRALGVGGASYLSREIGNLNDGVIGIGHGRTLLATIEAMPYLEAGSVEFVSLLGGLTRNYAANPHDVMHRLAEKTGAVAYVMPVPFLANSADDRDILLSQRGVRDVFELASRTDLSIVGIGSVQPDAQLVASRMVTSEEISEVRALGAEGELLGHFFNRDGEHIKTALTARTITPELTQLTDRRIVAIAGGSLKVNAIRAVLSSAVLTGLLTDERTANALIQDETF